MLRSRPASALRVAPVALIALVMSCDLLSPKEIDYRQRALDEVNRREVLWKGQAIRNYDFEYQRNCSPCSITATQPVEIHVRNDVITRIIDVTGGDVTPTADTPWPTVDSLYLWARQMLNDRRFAVEIEFDTVLNFPKHVRGEDPGSVVSEHNSATLVLQTAGAPVVGYLRPSPFSKSNKVTWRNR